MNNPFEKRLTGKFIDKYLVSLPYYDEYLDCHLEPEILLLRVKDSTNLYALTTDNQFKLFNINEVYPFVFDTYEKAYNFCYDWLNRWYKEVK
jgi:hypothetical protein